MLLFVRIIDYSFIIDDLTICVLTVNVSFAIVYLEYERCLRLVDRLMILILL